MSTLFAKSSSGVSAAATIADDTGYQAALANCDKINRRIGEIENRLFELQQGPPPPSHAKARAAAIAEGKADPGPLASGTIGEARALAEEIAVLERARPMAEKLQQDAQREASKAACKARQPEHLRLSRGIADALDQLRAALLAESQFRDDLIRDGFDFCGPLVPAAMPRLGCAEDQPTPYHAIATWFAEMAAAGVKLKQNK